MPSSFEHQIHQIIIYTSNRRRRMHINKKSSIGLKNSFTVWCRNNRRRSTCTTKLWHLRRSPMSVMLRTSWISICYINKGGTSCNSNLTG